MHVAFMSLMFYQESCKLHEVIFHRPKRVGKILWSIPLLFPTFWKNGAGSYTFHEVSLLAGLCCCYFPLMMGGFPSGVSWYSLVECSGGTTCTFRNWVRWVIGVYGSQKDIHHGQSWCWSPPTKSKGGKIPRSQHLPKICIHRGFHHRIRQNVPRNHIQVQSPSTLRRSKKFCKKWTFGENNKQNQFYIFWKCLLPLDCKNNPAGLCLNQKQFSGTRTETVRHTAFQGQISAFDQLNHWIPLTSPGVFPHGAWRKLGAPGFNTCHGPASLLDVLIHRFAPQKVFPGSPSFYCEIWLWRKS